MHALFEKETAIGCLWENDARMLTWCAHNFCTQLTRRWQKAAFCTGPRRPYSGRMFTAWVQMYWAETISIDGPSCVFTFRNVHLNATQYFQIIQFKFRQYLPSLTGNQLLRSQIN